MEWSGVKGGKWDNCNSIINKYIFLKTHHYHPPKKKKRKGKKATMVQSIVSKIRDMTEENRAIKIEEK